MHEPHWNGALERVGAAGSVRNTKDRDTPELEVRAGTLGVGCTSQDTVGFSSNNRSRVKVARRAQWRADCVRSLCSETEAGIRLLLL